MRGELTSVWNETWPRVWLPLLRPAGTPDDLPAELLREFAEAPLPPTEPPPPPPAAFDAGGNLTDPAFVAARAAYEADRLDFERRLASYEEALGGSRTRQALRLTLRDRPASEVEAAKVLSRGYDVVDGYGDDGLRNRYFLLVEAFFDRFSLRYDLRRPFSIQPTLSGIFSGLVRELKVVAHADAHLSALLFEFEESVRDLNGGTTDARIKTCIQKQVNMLEAMGRLNPLVTENTLGRICDQIDSWPHIKVKESMKNLYRFASDYPGIRHGGTPASAIRAIGMKDMVAMSVLLAGFVPYLSHQFDPQLAYQS
jgi:hypothetical protein